MSITKARQSLVALLNLSSWCLVMVERLFLAVPQGRLRFVIVVFPDLAHLLFSTSEQTTLVNLIFVIIVLLIVFFCYSVKVKFFKTLCIGYYCPVNGINVDLLQENGKYYGDVK